MIRIRQIKINYLEDQDKEIRKRCAGRLKINEKDIWEMIINKRSIDARKKPLVYFNYEIDLKVKNEEDILRKNQDKDVLLKPNEEYKYEGRGQELMHNRPIVVGMGPCGLFAAYMLACKGFKPLIIDRGDEVLTRKEKVFAFWQNNELDVNSNVQFGEGGAGTFSDGKLNTLATDKNNRGRLVFETFVKFGAPREIMYDNKPHIGTDILRNVVKGMREEIIKLGGEFRYRSTFNDLKIVDNKIKAIKINEEWVDTEVVVLAIGHSARDTFELLLDRNLEMQSKPFAVGLRIMQSQKMIDENQYGSSNEILGRASYKLTEQVNNRGVYTFCMCPGGYVVNASSEKDKLVINGMSNYARESKNANSAVIVTVNEKDYGVGVMAGVRFQQELEKRAYKIGQGLIPIQLVKDYYANQPSTKLGKLEPEIKGLYKFANLNEIFSPEINGTLQKALKAFNGKIKNFSAEDNILAGVEARTSSPLRILRDDALESNIRGIYPGGEGAGYAGGITSAAMDGIKIYEKILDRYRGINE